nr:uncharacterized protein LOC129437079 isoform X1 [Misgurnus anguillicaudatus]
MTNKAHTSTLGQSLLKGKVFEFAATGPRTALQMSYNPLAHPPASFSKRSPKKSLNCANSPPEIVLRCGLRCRCIHTSENVPLQLNLFLSKPVSITCFSVLFSPTDLSSSPLHHINTACHNARFNIHQQWNKTMNNIFAGSETAYFILYSTRKAVGEASSMSEYIVFEKQCAKSTRMTYYFRLDFAVCIRWTLHYPMMPRERSYPTKKKRHVAVFALK